MKKIFFIMAMGLSCSIGISQANAAKTKMIVAKEETGNVAPTAQVSRVTHEKTAIKSSEHFKSNADGTVTDKRTGLMWAAMDNGSDLNWLDANKYIQTYKAGGHKDWRLPTQKELADLFDKSESEGHTPFIKLSNNRVWSSTVICSEAAIFDFTNGKQQWLSQLEGVGSVLPVRSSQQHR